MEGAEEDNHFVKKAATIMISTCLILACANTLLVDECLFLDNTFPDDPSASAGNA
jgi:hypothetical protein